MYFNTKNVGIKIFRESQIINLICRFSKFDARVLLAMTRGPIARYLSHKLARPESLSSSFYKIIIICYRLFSRFMFISIVSRIFDYAKMKSGHERAHCFHNNCLLTRHRQVSILYKRLSVIYRFVYSFFSFLSSRIVKFSSRKKP